MPGHSDATNTAGSARAVVLASAASAGSGGIASTTRRSVTIATGSAAMRSASPSPAGEARDRLGATVARANARYSATADTPITSSAAQTITNVTTSTVLGELLERGQRGREIRTVDEH